MGRLAAQTVNLLSKRSPQANLLKGDMWWGDFVETLARKDKGGISEFGLTSTLATQITRYAGFQAVRSPKSRSTAYDLRSNSANVMSVSRRQWTVTMVVVLLETPRQRVICVTSVNASPNSLIFSLDVRISVYGRSLPSCPL